MPSDALPDDPDTLKAMLLAERCESERLRQIIREMQRHRFGRRAETLPEEQMLLGLEDVEQVAASGEAGKDESARESRTARAHKRRTNRGALPAHLPRIEIVVDIDDKTCPCCRGELHRIGEDKSERLDMVPAQFRVLVTRRPKYACRSCEDGVMQAPAPARVIEGGLPTEATVAQVLVSKYADHLPLYRQAQIYARQGIDLDRSTLADWVGHAAWHLRPLHERLLIKLKELPRLFADETTVPVLDPGRGRTKTGQLWAYAANDRPWGSADPPGVAYVYAADRKAERPIAHLAGFKGFCRSMAMPATQSSPSAVTLSLRSVGRICGAIFTNSPSRVPHRSRARRSTALPSSTPSKRISVATAPRSGASPGSRKAGR
jgi:transposase